MTGIPKYRSYESFPHISKPLSAVSVWEVFLLMHAWLVSPKWLQSIPPSVHQEADKFSELFQGFFRSR